MTVKTLYWTYTYNDEIQEDLEFKTSKIAYEHGNDKFCEECEDEGGWSNGDTKEMECELIQYTLDDKTQKMEIQNREKTAFEFEYYHGDLAEHGTYW